MEDLFSKIPTALEVIIEHSEPKTQKECVLLHLQNKSLSMPTAVNEYNIYRLASVIHQLKKDGHNIITKEIKFTNRYGHESSYAEYQLLKPTTNEH